MGILNITGDSFSDGGKFLDPEKAFRQAEKLIRDGADIIDIGGESTRPGSQPVSEDEELERVIPVLKRIRSAYPDLAISVDTRKSKVAEEAIAIGIQIVNDISALRGDSSLAVVLAQNPQVQVILMHMLGEPETMQKNPRYEEVVDEVSEFFAECIAVAGINGISRKRIMLDPGIGFGKTTRHNLRLLANLESFRHFGLPLVVGASRKSFISAINASQTDERIGGSLAVAMVSALQQIEILRVHDVKAHRQFFDVINSIAGETY
ncbi:MAG: dihydropteroate synthase [Candidatus Syntrophosphaera sp.]